MSSSPEPTPPPPLAGAGPLSPDGRVPRSNADPYRFAVWSTVALGLGLTLVSVRYAQPWLLCLTGGAFTAFGALAVRTAVNERRRAARLAEEARHTLAAASETRRLAPTAHRPEETAQSAFPQEALLNQMGLLAAITSQAPGVFFQFEVTPDGARGFPFLSEGFRRIFGLDPAVGVRRPGVLFASVLPEDRASVRESLENAIARTVPWQRIYRIRRNRRSIVWISASSTVAVRADGTKVWFGLLTDITELQQARFESEQLNARLEAAIAEARASAEKARQASIAKGQFLANMSHEIRTPMNAVIGMTSLLLDTPLGTRQREFAEIIRTSGESLLSLVNEILDFSKIESGKFELENETFNLRECIEGTLDLLGPRASAKGLALDCSLRPGTPVAVRGDGSRLRQILVNLVGNAIKFTDTGSIHVSVGSAPAEDGVHELAFSVRDTGIGIPPEAHGRLFDSFSQVDASISRRYGGTGLGLAISRRLAELMGGRMWLESAPGAGSTFHFTLRVRPAPDIAPPSAAEAPLPAARALRLLLAEDNVVNQKVAIHLLAKLGYRAEVAANGLEVLAALRRRTFDVILMDVQMPEMDGLEATRRVLSEWPDRARRPWIIALTANAMEGDREMCLAAGMDDYVSKPIKPARLAAALDRAPRLAAGELLYPLQPV